MLTNSGAWTYIYVHVSFIYVTYCTKQGRREWNLNYKYFFSSSSNSSAIYISEALNVFGIKLEGSGVECTDCFGVHTHVLYRKLQTCNLRAVFIYLQKCTQNTTQNTINTIFQVLSRIKIFLRICYLNMF